MAGPLIDLVRVHPDAEVPAYATAGANGFDLCAWWTGPELFKVVKAKQTLMVGTGWKFGLPNPWALVVLPRSGMGAKQGVVLGNLCLWNRGSVDRIITRGDAVCQAVAMPIEQATFRVVDKFKTTTARGAGGYGSTDKGKA